MNHTPEMNAIGPALVAAMAEMPAVGRDSTGRTGQREYRYASLVATGEIVHPILTKHGLTYVQDIYPEGDPTAGGFLVCTTKLIHGESGQWVECRAVVPATCPDNKEAGIATTYVRRYGLTAALGILVQDEDPDGGSGPQKGSSGASRPARNGGGGARRGGSSSPASEPQLKAIYAKTRSLDLPEAEARRLLPDDCDTTKDLTKAQASDILDRLTEMEDAR